MDKKRILVSAVVFLILAALVYFQFREWQAFDWARFRALSHQIKWFHVLHAVAWIYFGYVLRAIRWKIFLRPVRPKASSWGLISPTLIGFTGLALLGRPGELIRPYLISRRENLPFSSQKLHQLLGYSGQVSNCAWEATALHYGQQLPTPSPLFMKFETPVAYTK